MNPKQLEQDLALPNIEASLVAYHDTLQKNKWYIRFVIPGPDRRYSPGITVVPSLRVPKLVSDLKKAHNRMKLLEQEKYSGKFSEDFVLCGEVSDTLSVTVSSEKSQFLIFSYKSIRLHFLVSSKTNTFSRSFDIDDVENIINILSSTEYLAAKLVKQLQAEKVVTACPRCSQKLRAPINLGTLSLTCPKCKHSWPWPPR